jgi:hypothetical protein
VSDVLVRKSSSQLQSALAPSSGGLRIKKKENKKERGKSGELTE